MNEYYNTVVEILEGEHCGELKKLVLEQAREYILEETASIPTQVLSEADFFTPKDSRILKSGVNNIDETNNFNQYAKEFFELCDEEELY